MKVFVSKQMINMLNPDSISLKREKSRGEHNEAMLHETTLQSLSLWKGFD